MHCLLLASAVLVAWSALGSVVMNVVLGMFRRGLMPISGPNTVRLLAHFLPVDY